MATARPAAGVDRIAKLQRDHDDLKANDAKMQKRLDNATSITPSPQRPQQEACLWWPLTIRDGSHRKTERRDAG